MWPDSGTYTRHHHPPKKANAASVFGELKLHFILSDPRNSGLSKKTECAYWELFGTIGVGECSVEKLAIKLQLSYFMFVTRQCQSLFHSAATCFSLYVAFEKLPVNQNFKILLQRYSQVFNVKCPIGLIPLKHSLIPSFICLVNTSSYIGLCSFLETIHSEQFDSFQPKRLKKKKIKKPKPSKLTSSTEQVKKGGNTHAHTQARAHTHTHTPPLRFIHSYLLFSEFRLEFYQDA